jgi:hypothetical protein
MLQLYSGTVLSCPWMMKGPSSGTNEQKITTNFLQKVKKNHCDILQGQL